MVKIVPQELGVTDVCMLDPNLEVDGVDEEAISARRAVLRIQERLSAVMEEPRLAKLRKTFLDADAMEDVLCVDELHAKHQDHTCIWALNPVTEPVMPEADWQCAVRL